MFPRSTTVLAAALLLLAPVASQAGLLPYTQTFETLTISDPAALSNDGWVVYGNVWDPTHVTYLYGYGAYPAPNGGTAFSAVVSGQGGTPQGAQQLSVYNDYNNLGAMNAGDQVEANVYQQQTVAAGDIRSTWTFQFDAKLGNLVLPTKALAFVKAIDPLHGYAQTRFYTIEMDTITSAWHTYFINIPIDTTLVGQYMQFGFNSTTTSYIGSGVFYDNIYWFQSAHTGVAPAAQAAVLDLRPASPNPFTASTRVDWSMAQQGNADLTVYDVTGRHVATLFHGQVGAGPHSATWDGRATDGRPAPVGVYRAVLQTPAGRLARSLVLTR